MGIVACDTCNKTDPPTYNKALVVFQFPRGSLQKAGAGEVEDIIGQVFTISDDAQQGEHALRPGVVEDVPQQRNLVVEALSFERPHAHAFFGGGNHDSRMRAKNK